MIAEQCNFFKEIINYKKGSCPGSCKEIPLFYKFENFNFSQMTVPVWINADILMGPVNATEEQAKAVDAKQFLSTIVKDFPDFLVSVGWVTK